MSKRSALIAYVSIAVLVAWPLCAGMFYHDSQAIMLRPYDGVHEFEWARRERRRDLGFAIMSGGLYASMWPIGLPMAFCMTGFAEHGIWSQKLPR